ncbi:MAG: penicillin-binding protein 1A [Parvularculaceae bacterium]
MSGDNDNSSKGAGDRPVDERDDDPREDFPVDAEDDEEDERDTFPLATDPDDAAADDDRLGDDDWDDREYAANAPPDEDLPEEAYDAGQKEEDGEAEEFVVEDFADKKDSAAADSQAFADAGEDLEHEDAMGAEDKRDGADDEELRLTSDQIRTADARRAGRKKDIDNDLFAEKPAHLRDRRSSQDPGVAQKESGRIAAAFKALGFLFAAGALAIVGFAGYAAWYLNKLSNDLPDYAALAEYAPPVTTRVYAGDGTLVAEFARERRLFVPVEAIPDAVKYAFVSAEDKTFYEHNGVDIRGLVRSQLTNLRNFYRGRLEGGSTITQQVAKNFLLSSEQRIERKLREMMIARRMEKAFSKDHILELYLNEIYLGNRSYGVAAAALNYFDKALSDLTVAEAAYLAAIAKGPSNYHPIDHVDRAITRRNWVIGRMLEDGRISQTEADAARLAPLGAQLAPPLGARDWASEYFAEEVRKQIIDLYGVEALYDGGLAVRTTLDPNLQKTAGEALRKWLVEYDQRHGWRGPLAEMEIGETWAEDFAALEQSLYEDRTVAEDMAPWRPAVVLEAGETTRIGFSDGTEGFIPFELLSWAQTYIDANTIGDEITSGDAPLNRGDVVYVAPTETDGVFALRQIPAVNGGLIALDPHTGRVLAMVGGFSFQLSEFNRAVQAHRQPGSTFKPFVYSAALDSGYTPSSIVLDAPFVAPGVDSWWKPGNYVEGRFYGESTLRLGIEQSRNTMTARLAQDLGIGRIIEYVKRFNLSDRLPRELAISLGSGETTLTRITAAYSIFVNGGKRIEPVIIDRIQDRTGKTIYKRDLRGCPACNVEAWAQQAEPQLADPREQVMDPRTAYQVVSLLEGVVLRGTGSAVRRAIDKPIAGKTGTTNEYKDAWFVGFSPDLAAGVFVGFDMPRTLGQGEAGGKVAAPVFADFMLEALKNVPGIPFRVPSGIRLVRVNAKTGRPATASDRNVILEAFKSDDVIGDGLSADELSLDPLSAAPKNREEDNDDAVLDGLY